MYLTEYEQRVYIWLQSLGITETFPYKESGVLGVVDSIEDVYFKAVFSYDCFSLEIETNQHYSANEIRNIKAIQRYQKKMSAYYKPFQSKRTTITEEDVRAYTHEKLKGLFNKAYKVNRGIYYLSGLKGYTSTTLYENPTIEPGAGHGVSVGCGMYRKYRTYGKIAVVAVETLKLFDGTELVFNYPFSIKGRETSSNSIYEVYDLAYKHGENFELLEDRRFYSSQQKKIVKKLKKLGVDKSHE